MASFAWRRPPRCRTTSSAIRLILAAGILAAVLTVAGTSVPGLVSAQLSAGATLTVLRGNVGVLRADGTPVSPAASGLTLATGDQVATVGRSSALVTFFEGSEVELGADSTIVLRDLGAQGGSRSITIESVIGTTVHRVVTVLDSGSTYRVEAGGAVALVRGTVFAHHVDPGGDVTLAVSEGQVEFPRAGLLVRRGEKRTVTSRGDIVDGRFDPTISLFTAVTEAVASGNASGTENPGLGTGSYVVPQQQSAVQQRDEQRRDTQQQPLSGRTVLISAAAGGSVRLDVASIDGFAIGDLVRIGTGPGSEIGTIVGFGSIILQEPLSGSFGVGTVVERIAPGSLVATTTAVPTPTATGTVGVVGTVVPPPTATATPVPTQTATTTPSQTPTATPSQTLTPTPTVTSTASATPTPSNTPAHTPTVTSTASATPTVTLTATATGTPTASATPTLTPTATPVFPCLGPLTRALATRGSGTTGTTLRSVTGGVSLDVYIELIDAAPRTTFDLWVDASDGIAGIHGFVGSFTTDDHGNAIFTGTVVVPSVGALIDNEIILGGEIPSRHQYIRESFAPCTS